MIGAPSVELARDRANMPWGWKNMLLNVIIINCKDKFKTLILQEVTICSMA